jgi:nucleotide-binding universal stress UspA family protein
MDVQKRPKPYRSADPKCGAKTKSGRPCQNTAGKKTDHVGEGRCWLHGGATPIKHGRYSVIQRQNIKERIAQFESDADPLNLLPEVLLLRALTADLIDRYDELVEGLHRWHVSFESNYLQARMNWLQDVQAFTRPEINGLHTAVLVAIDNLVEMEGQDDALDLLIDGAKQTLEQAIKPSRVKLGQIPPAPDPLSFVDKPRKLLDISEAANLIDKVGKMVERIEKQKQEGTIKLETLDRVLEQLGVEVVKAVQQHVADPDSRSQILRDVEERWGSIRLEPTASRSGTSQSSRSLN